MKRHERCILVGGPYVHTLVQAVLIYDAEVVLRRLAEANVLPRLKRYHVVAAYPEYVLADDLRVDALWRVEGVSKSGTHSVKGIIYHEVKTGAYSIEEVYDHYFDPKHTRKASVYEYEWDDARMQYRRRYVGKEGRPLWRRVFGEPAHPNNLRPLIVWGLHQYNTHYNLRADVHRAIRLGALRIVDIELIADLLRKRARRVIEWVETLGGYSINVRVLPGASRPLSQVGEAVDCANGGVRRG